MDTSDNAAAGWVTIAEAAARLEVSDRTIRRRVRDGELTSRKHKGRVLILLADDTMKRAGGDGEPDMAALADIVRRQDAEIQYLRGALAQALALQRPQLAAPARPWRWPWQRGD